MGIAVGLDAFSLSFSIGLKLRRLRYIMIISLIVGLFHIIMPLIGLLLGHFLNDHFGQVTSFIGAAILFYLGADMVWKYFSEKEPEKKYSYSIISIILFAFSVSIDSLTAGFSLGLIDISIIHTVISFGFYSTLLTALGLFIGKKVSNIVGEYGIFFSGMILMLFSLHIFGALI